MYAFTGDDPEKFREVVAMCLDSVSAAKPVPDNSGIITSGVNDFPSYYIHNIKIAHI
jgi:hypothetical protein